MKKTLWVIMLLLVSLTTMAQTIGSTKTEQYKASFETKIDISQFLDYLEYFLIQLFYFS